MDNRQNWSSSETEEMLKIIKEKNILHLTDGKKYRSLEIYKQVQKEMEKNGYYRSPDQIRTKLKLLKKKYIEARNNNNTSGAARMECEFYELLEEIFQFRPSVSCITGGIDSSREDSQSEDNTPKKMSKKEKKEEKMIREERQWLENEFEKQREFEKEMLSQFQQTITQSFENFIQTAFSISGNRLRTSSLNSLTSPSPESNSPLFSSSLNSSNSSIFNYFTTFNPENPEEKE